MKDFKGMLTDMFEVPHTPQGVQRTKTTKIDSLEKSPSDIKNDSDGAKMEKLAEFMGFED